MENIELSHKGKIGRCVMRLKPRNTLKGNIALLYKRFINIEKSFSTETLYNTTEDGLFWLFDSTELKFIKADPEVVDAKTNIVSVTSSKVFQYGNKYFKYDMSSGWIEINEVDSQIQTLERAGFNNIAKYQTNKYYYVGSFDYMIKGSIEGTETQYIKGNIIPLKAMNIKYYNDDINLSVGDLVVCEGRLFSVENPETDYKYQPKPYAIHYATLNSIL